MANAEIWPDCPGAPGGHLRPDAELCVSMLSQTLERRNGESDETPLSAGKNPASARNRALDFRTDLSDEFAQEVWRSPRICRADSRAPAIDDWKAWTGYHAIPKSPIW